MQHYFAWEDLRDLAQADFHAAQTRLMDILSDYQGIKGCILILVFDAYRVEGHPEETFQYHNIHVVYTREAETADQYIERTVHKIGRKHNVTVATSDGLEQIIIMGQGAARISARGFKEEIASAKQQMREEWQERRDSSKTYLFDSMTPELKSHMEDIRLGRKKKKNYNRYQKERTVHREIKGVQSFIFGKIPATGCKNCTKSINSLL